jgi:hypothetical protein
MRKGKIYDKKKARLLSTVPGSTIKNTRQYSRVLKRRD